MVQLTIKITKEILERSKLCSSNLGENCAIANAVRSIFPQAWVEDTRILPFFNSFKGDRNAAIQLPAEAVRFIGAFDMALPEQRTQMPELEFTVDIPDAVIDRINIDEIRPLLVSHPTLTLIEA